MLKLRTYLKNYKKEVFLGPAFKLLEAILELIAPMLMADIIDNGVNQHNPDYIYRMGGIMVLIAAIGLGSAIVCQYFAACASQGFGTDLRNAMFRHISELSHAEIDKIGTPSLITRLTNDVNQLQVAVAMLIRLVIRAPFLVIGATVMAMMIDLKISVIFLIAAIAIAVCLYFITTRSVPFYRAVQKLLDGIALITRENLSGARVIRAFARQKTEEKRFNNESEELEKTALRVGKISALLNPLTYLIVNAAIIAIIWFGGGAVNTGGLEQGQIVAFVQYMNQILLALIVVANLVVIFTKASASAARVNEVFSYTSSVQESGSVLPKLKGNTPIVEFNDVTFSFGSGGNVLCDINVKIFQGQTIGIIGGTGSGKSTFVNLIPRFYDATSGSILVNGINVRDYRLKDLREKIGIVPQKPVLFTGTIRENMKWRDPDATDAQIWEALSVAQAKDFVEALPERLDTQILQGGKNLSGGQRQRLTIARAIVGDPEILILDDSSSALDYATDASLRKALKQYSKKSTVLTVSQRAATVKNCDNIIVFDEGVIVGMGKHNELFETNAIYREICLSQLDKQKEGAHAEHA